MSERMVYLAGYSGREPTWLLSAAVRLDAVVFDIRFSPFSRRAEWSKANLVRLLGDRYRHVRGFGNEAYQSSAIRLHDPDAGLAEFDAETRPVILLCQCKQSKSCHRRTVADLLVAERGVIVVEVDDAGEEAVRQASLVEEGAQ